MQRARLALGLGVVVVERPQVGPYFESLGRDTPSYLLVREAGVGVLARQVGAVMLLYCGEGVVLQLMQGVDVIKNVLLVLFLRERHVFEDVLEEGVIGCVVSRE